MYRGKHGSIPSRLCNRPSRNRVGVKQESKIREKKVTMTVEGDIRTHSSVVSGRYTRKQREERSQEKKYSPIFQQPEYPALDVSSTGEQSHAKTHKTIQEG